MRERGTSGVIAGRADPRESCANHNSKLLINDCHGEHSRGVGMMLEVGRKNTSGGREVMVIIVIIVIIVITVMGRALPAQPGS